MRQLTLRVPDQLADRLKGAAERQGRSANSLASAVLEAALDPDLAGDEAVRLRERLAAAGLLFTPEPKSEAERPPAGAVAAARRRAAKGRPLADMIAEDRA